MAKSRVSFLYGNFMQYDGRTIEASTMSPDELLNIVNDVEKLIREKLLSMPGNDRPDLNDRPVILVARLAVIQKREAILSPLGKESVSAIHMNVAEIIPDFWPHWQALAKSAFGPQVRSAFEGGGARVDGAWLGIYNKS